MLVLFAIYKRFRKLEKDAAIDAVCIIKIEFSHDNPPKASKGKLKASV